MDRGIGAKRALTILLLASFIVNLGFSALSPVFPYLVLALKGVLKELPELTIGMIEAHRGAFELGLLTGAFMATRAPMAIFSGFLSDLFGRKRIIILGMLLYLASATGFILAQDVATLIIFRAVQGLASGMVWPVAEAYIADVTKRWQRGKALSAYTSSMLIAELIGPAIGVIVYKAWCIFFGPSDYLMVLKSPIIFLALMTAASLTTLTLLPTIKGRSKSSRVRARFEELELALNSLPRSAARSLKTMYFNGAVNGFGMGILQTALIVYAIELIVKDPAYIGIYYIVASGSALPASILSGYITDRLKRRKPAIILGYIVGRGVFFLIPLIRDPTLLLLLAIPASMTFGVSVPAMRALQADLTPREVRGSIFGVQQFFMNGGVFIGSILGGWLTQAVATQTYRIASQEIEGIVLPFWITGILGILTTILFILYVEEPS